MSKGLMVLFLIEYVVAAIVFLIESRYGIALYWLGAAIIQTAVIIGVK